jgi:ribose 5-phosphate isomerase A
LLTKTDELKEAAARAALDLVTEGMRLGLGTGSTAARFVAALGERVAGGLNVLCVPTSEATREQAVKLGIPITTLDETPRLDLTIDGADEIDPGFNLIKGGGAALLQEKIIEAASKRLVVIADDSKAVPQLGAFPLPVEIVRFGWNLTHAAVVGLLETMPVAGRRIAVRKGSGGPLVTDEGHYILDLHLERIDDPRALATALNAIPGVVEHGLFIDMATSAVLGRPDGTVDVLYRPGAEPGDIAEQMRNQDA